MLPPCNVTGNISRQRAMLPLHYNLPCSRIMLPHPVMLPPTDKQLSLSWTVIMNANWTIAIEATGSLDSCYYTLTYNKQMGGP